MGPSTSLAAATERPLRAVITGNPNCGKTTLFNALTGLRAKVANYGGVTVERKEGRILGLPDGVEATLLDLPGTYSLSPQSIDEQIARDVLLRRLSDVPAPDVVVVVMDASNLERNLYYATQVLELGYPTLVVLNMMDVAEANGHVVDIARMKRELGVPVIPTVASTRQGVAELRAALLAAGKGPSPAVAPSFADYPEAFSRGIREIVRGLRSTAASPPFASAEAALVLGDARNHEGHIAWHGAQLQPLVAQVRTQLEDAGVDWRTAPIEARYARIAAIRSAAVVESRPNAETFSDRVDRVVTHKVWGTLIFFGIMGLMFQTIFTFAKLPMNLLEHSVDWVGGTLTGLIPPGDLHSLLADGIVSGVGSVVVFLPQICLLFVFIGLLEDTGYMARAAFLMDRLMSKVGLHGKSFIPMLSSFACAIPGILSTRTIESHRDRLVTIFIAPFMSCSARLPVYTLLIGACIPDRRVLGILKLPGLTLLSMYLLGIILALGTAWLLKRTLLRGETPLLIMELPPYKRPSLRTLGRHVWDRANQFLRNAGTVILAINILLWFLATYPRNPELSAQFDRTRLAAIRAAYPAIGDDAGARAVLAHVRATPTEPTLGPRPTGGADQLAVAPTLGQQVAQLDAEEAGARVRDSFAGRLGRCLEPVISPLGFDWRIGIGIITSFAAREVFVSTMAVVYNLGQEREVSTSLIKTLQRQQRADGTPVYSVGTGLTLMVFYVIALQCASTLTVVRRETGGWKWPILQWTYMAGLAWVVAFVVRTATRLSGLP